MARDHSVNLYETENVTSRNGYCLRQPKRHTCTDVSTFCM